MKTTIKRLTQGATRLLVLALGLGLAATGWATDLQVTITDSTVVIDNDNAGTFDHMTFYVNSPVLTIPASATLPLGTQIQLTSISLGKRASGSGNTRPETLSITGTDGTVYTSDAIVESGTFTNAGCTKEVYSFSGKGCVLTVGLSYAMSFKNSDGSDFGTLVSRTAKDSASLFGTTVYNSTYTAWLPVQELAGEIVGSTSFTLLTGAQTDIKNTDTTKPLYLHNATGWISTSTESSGEIKLVNGPAGYALAVNNGNSIAANNKNRVSVWKKLSGDGLLTTADNNWQTPAVKIYDASDFTGSINASAGNVYLAVIFCAEADTFSPSVYEEIGSKSGLIYIKSGTSVTVASGATWTAVNGIVNKGTLIVNGTVASPISNSGGTVTVNAGATISSFGTTRDFTGVTVDSSIPVKITMTSEEYGKGSVSVTGATGISSITVFAPDGTTQVGTITPEAGVGTLETGVKTSGIATWCDYEMDYVSGTKTGFENTGTDTTELSGDGVTGDSAFYNGMLYTYAHPWRNIAYPSDGNWTAVVRCTVPAYENAAVITFGTKDGGLIGLVAGANPETQMRLVQTTGNSHFVTNATMTVQNATTAQHVYIFSVENNQTVKVYCDGDQVLNKTFDSQFTIGGGIQVGSVHGGVGNTGIIRFAKDESPAKDLSETVQKEARIDCVRLYQYSLSAAQIAALSVEFPAVKLYRATVAANANTDWGSLTWSPSWDGGNSSSKIILTVEGDASLTLPDSITANEFVMNVPAANALTLSKASGGTTLSVTEPIEIAGGTIYFNPGISQPIGLGDLNFGGTGTVRLGNGKLVNNSISGSASVELLSGASAIMYGGSISNPLKGAGLLDYSYGNSLPSALSFGDWTGTVKLPGFTADALNLNNYGKAGSTVEITAVNGGWIAEAGKTVAPTIKLSGNMTIDAMSSWTYTFAEITGSGNLSFSTSGNSPTVNITKVAEGYSGTISSTLSNPVTIATLDRAAETPVTAGSKLLSTSSGVQASALTLAGVATSISPVFDTDGLYVKAASVTKNDATANYDTVSAALTAAGNDAATIKLLMPTDSAIALAAGQTLVNGNLTSGGVTGPNGYEVVNNNGTYTLVDNTASTWAPGDGSDNSWNTGANWSTGYKPNAYTAVTFPSGTHTVSITGHSDSADETAKCASMQLVGDVTFQRGGSDWTYLLLGGNITGSGTMTLARTGIKVASNSAVSIGCPVVGNAASDDNFFSSGTFTFNNTVNVAAGEFKAEYADLVFGALVTLANGGYVNANGSGSTATFNGGISVPENAAASLTVSSGGTHTIASTVALADGATFTIPTASTTVSGATFATSVADSYVKGTVDGSTTVYSVAAKRTATVSVGTNASLSINGNAVSDGDAVKFVPGDVLTITASADTYYTPALTVNGVAQTSPYELTTTDDDVTVSATATRDTVAITIPSVANTTVSVSYTSSGEALVATAAGDITVDAGTSLTATWTAVSGYRITAGAEQTINPVASAQTLAEPMVVANEVTFGGYTVEYTADYTKAATISATVSGDGAEGATYTLTAGGNNYNGTYNAGTVTFSNVTAPSLGGELSYTISATGTASGTSPAQTETVGNVTSGWVQEDATHNESTGTWETDITYSAGVATITDNTYTPTKPGDGIVTLTTVVKFGDDADPEVQVGDDAQAAIRIQSVESTPYFQVYAKATSEGTAGWQTTSVQAEADTTYTVSLTINYVTRTFTASVQASEAESATPLGETWYLATAATKISAVAYKGTGEFTSLNGSFVSGDIAVTVETANDVAVSSAFISEYLKDKTVTAAAAALNPNATQKSNPEAFADNGNGINYFTCYALGLDPTEDDDKLVVDVSTDSSGNFVFTVKHPTFDGEGNITGYEVINAADNVQATVTYKYGTTAGSTTIEAVLDEGGKISPSAMFDGQSGNVLYYKAEVSIGAK